MQSLASLSEVKDGFLRDYLLRIQFAKDLGWWELSKSPWRLTEYHQRWDATDYNPDYWRDRASRLCAYDLLHTNFGMGFLDLMSLDVPTFEYIEEQVHKLAEVQSKRLSQEVKENDKK